jgi:hypothetical protein
MYIAKILVCLCMVSVAIVERKDGGAIRFIAPNYIISITKYKYLTSKYLEHEKIRLLRNL